MVAAGSSRRWWSWGWPSAPSWRRPRPGRPPSRRRRRTARARCRTSTWPARTASAPRATGRSKVWYTVADGVLSDVYYPTNDNTNNETLQYVVTDGSTFTDLQTRDMTYTVQRARRPSADVPGHRHGQERQVPDRHRLPHRPAAAPTVRPARRFEALKGKTRDYKLYVRFDPTLNGNGGGGTGNGGADSGTSHRRRPHRARRLGPRHGHQRRQPRLRAAGLHRARRRPAVHRRSSNGYAGAASDGLTQLDAPTPLTATYTDAAPGNLVQTAQVDLGRTARSRSRSASARPRPRPSAPPSAALRTPLRLTRSRATGRLAPLRRRPRRAAAPARRLARRLGATLLDTYYLSANYVKAREDKTFPGAIAAALASPVGPGDLAPATRRNTYFGSYREVFARDLYEAWTAAATWPATARPRAT